MIKLNCLFTRARMTAYINRDLAPLAARHVGRHLDVCPMCYAAYVRERRFAADLERDLSRVGAPSANQLERIWQGVQAEFNAPPLPEHRSVPDQLRWGVAAALVLLMVFLATALFGQPGTAQAQHDPPPRSVAIVTPTADHPVGVNVIDGTDQAQQRTVTVEHLEDNSGVATPSHDAQTHSAQLHNTPEPVSTRP